MSADEAVKHLSHITKEKQFKMDAIAEGIKAIKKVEAVRTIIREADYEDVSGIVFDIMEILG